MTRTEARHAFSACCAIFNALLHYDLLLHSFFFFFFLKIGLIYLHIIYRGICLKIITLHFPWYNLFPDGSKEVLNHNEYLQLRARWWGQLWHLFYFFLWSVKTFPHSLSAYLSVCWSLGLGCTAWMLWRRQEKGVTGAPGSLCPQCWAREGERQAAANGRRMGAGSGDFDQCSEGGGSYFAPGQNSLQPEATHPQSTRVDTLTSERSGDGGVEGGRGWIDRQSRRLEDTKSNQSAWLPPLPHLNRPTMESVGH